jgi:hypothetical protein
LPLPTFRQLAERRNNINIKYIVVERSPPLGGFRGQKIWGKWNSINQKYVTKNGKHNIAIGWYRDVFRRQREEHFFPPFAHLAIYAILYWVEVF